MFFAAICTYRKIYSARAVKLVVRFPIFWDMWFMERTELWIQLLTHKCFHTVSKRLRTMSTREAELFHQLQLMNFY